MNPTVNIDIEGYKPFIYDPTETTHGGTGFFIRKSLTHNKRDDLSQYSKGNYQSTFIEIVIPNKKNVVVGCIYRHPSSTLPISHFVDNFIETVIDKILYEGKTSIIMGDFNLDLLKIDVDKNINDFYNFNNRPTHSS